MARMKRLILTAIVVLTFCPAARAAVRIEDTDYPGYGPAYRVTNGEAELVVVPAVGRIIRYAFVNGQNALWENPNTKNAKGYWHFGGEKVWPWPQDEWRDAGGRKAGWPPPPGADPLKIEARAEAGVLVLTSTVIPDYGVRLVREIRLADTGSEVVMTSRFEKVADGRDDPVAVWTIAQVPDPELVLARISESTALEKGYLPMGLAEFKSIRREANLLSIERSPSRSTKIGLDGDLLAAVRNRVLFVQEYVESATTKGEHRPGHRAQVYGNPDKTDAHPADVPPYVELEFTSPMKKLAKGDSVALTLKWSLHHVRSGDRAAISELVGARPASGAVK
jgi:hypothetical protein